MSGSKNLMCCKVHWKLLTKVILYFIYGMFLTVVETQNESLNNGFDDKHGARVPIVTFHYQS